MINKDLIKKDYSFEENKENKNWYSRTMKI